jgi:hypothetical protein
MLVAIGGFRTDYKASGSINLQILLGSGWLALCLRTISD